MTLVRKAVFMLGLLFVSTGLVHAQTVVTGTPPFGTFGGGPADSINLANLNVHLTIPVLSKPGRGIPFTYDVTYDGSIWQPVGTTGSQTWQPTNTGAFGWSFPAVGSLVAVGQSSALTCGQWYGVPGNYYWVWGGGNYVTGYTYKDVLGTPHNFPGGVTYYWGCAGNGYTAYTGTATDGSDYKLTVTSGAGTFTVTARNGQTSAYTSSGQNITNTPLFTDTNGNQITLNSSNVFTDTLGQAAMTVSGTAPSNTNFQYKDTNGNTQQYTMKYTSYTVKSNFGCSGITEYPATAQSLVSEIDRPDGSKYTFTYEATPGYSGDVTGRLASVTLPTGGTISYAYYSFNWGAQGGIDCADGSAGALVRYTPDGNWYYNRTAGSGAATTTSIVDPQNNETVMNFQGIYQTEAQVYQGLGTTLLRTTNTCYNGAAQPCNSTAITLPITEVTAQLVWPGNLESQTITKYNSTTGVLTETDEYDYGQGAPGGLIRKTLTSYASLTNGIVGAPSQVSIYDGGSNLKAQTNYTYDGATLVSSGITTQHVSVSGSRGNATQISSLVSGSTYVNQNLTYFDTGMVNVAKDAKNNPTTYAYASTYQGAYPTTITNALNQVTTVAYDINSGLVTSAKDPNNQTTSYSYDLLFRPTQVNYPDLGYTGLTYYSNFQGGSYVEAMQKMDTSGHQRNTFTWFDGLGRQARVAVSNGESLAYDETQNTCFNSIGLVSLQGYPFQDNGWSSPISCSVAGDSYTYDALSRPLTITHADGSHGAISYTANCATATDEQGKTRQVCVDGLGRVTSVVENPSGLNYTTTYAYDALNNLTTVTQGVETRSFAYDGLSRLTSATNPESGATSYTYDAASNVATRVDARSITTTYSYDALNRLTQKSYSDGTAAADYYYDSMPSWWGSIGTSNPIGRLVAEGAYKNGTWASASWVGYDPLGRIVSNPQYPVNSLWNLQYTYDLIGDMASYTDGLGETYTQTFNAAGLPTQLTSSWVDSGHPATLASGVHYNGAGSVTSFTYGNGLTHTRVYNSLLQPCLIDVNSSSTLLQTCNDSSPSGNVLDFWYGYSAGSSDNGNVMNWNATGSQSSIRTYTYDALNRLSTMADSVQSQSCRGLSWSYDQWGNRTAQNVTAGTCGSSQLTFNSSNRVTNSGFQYDAAGNMTHDASHSYTYDAENRITAVDGGSTATYAYGADGRRVSKTAGGSQTNYLYDLGGQVISEFNSSSWLNIYLRLNGALFAQYSVSPYRTQFIHLDHLGSTRLLTGYPAGTVVECDDYYPFGELTSCGGTSTTTHKFTGYERDPESNLDNAQARYNSSSLGRFMSPDPIGNFVADATNPQSWNMYAYVNNNPLSFIDPTGTDPDGSGYYDCLGSGNDPANCVPDQCDTNGCIVYVSAPKPDPVPIVPCSGGCTPTTGGGGTGGSGFTLGVRQPGQTYKACMVANANNYSIGGAVELGANVATGTSTSFSSNPAVSAFTGNSVTGVISALSGSGTDAASAAATATPALIGQGMGSTLTYGRRTSNILSLNLAGTGGLPRALGSSTGAVSRVLGSVEKALKLGLGELKDAADVGLAGAEAIGCSIPQ